MLTTLATLKAVLYPDAQDGTEDAKLTQMLAGADAAVKSYLSLPNLDVQQSYTEFCSGNNTKFLRLKQRPVASVTNVWADGGGFWGQGPGGFGAFATLLTAGVQYALVPDQPDGSSRSGLLMRLDTVWSPSWQRMRGLLSMFVGPGLGNVKVQYVGGYASVPQDLQMAVCLIVSRLRQTMPRGQLMSSESYEGYSYNLISQAGKTGQSDLLGPAAAVLARYRPLEL